MKKETLRDYMANIKRERVRALEKKYVDKVVQVINDLTKDDTDLCKSD